jgi:hypothetical protein
VAPNGSTNTSQVEFKSGGRWVFTTHSPNGGNPKNESVFELVEPRKIVIRHISQPLAGAERHVRKQYEKILRCCNIDRDLNVFDF